MNLAKKSALKVFLLQLGGPENMAAIEPFLRNLFADVLPVPALIRKPLAAFVAKRRTPKVAPLYQELGGGSPLLKNTQAQATALQQELTTRGYLVDVLVCMRYAPPGAAEALKAARQGPNNAAWVALPLYPQYSFATTRSSVDELQSLLEPHEDLLTISEYPAHKGYIEAMTATVREGLAMFDAAERDSVHLVFSAHGLPMRQVRDGDPYPEHVNQTVAAVLQRLGTKQPWTLCFQSRVGPVKWLEPSTEATLKKLGAEGCKNALVVPVSFVSDHIETLHELDIQLRVVAEAAGIRAYHRAPVVATRPEFIRALADLVETRLDEGDHSRIKSSSSIITSSPGSSMSLVF